MARFESLGMNYRDPLEQFSSEERDTIREKIHVLSSLVYLIGKDYGMNVEVNPEQGWHWDFENNVVRVDPHDLLVKPIEFLRFVMSHEAGHRRISRVKGVVPDEVWQQPGFSFLMNAIEDPRDNNFVADNIPHFRDEMKSAYGSDSDEAKFESSMKDEALKKFGKQPRFMQAGFEYMKLWSVGEEPILTEDLPEEVRDVVIKTLAAARASWNTYPSLKEADEGVTVKGKDLTGEEAVTEYARASFNINHRVIWPLFKTLIDKDIEDAKQQGKGKGNDSNQGEGNPEQGDDANQQPSQESVDQPKQAMSQEEAEAMIKEFAKELAKHFQGEELKSEEQTEPEVGDIVDGADDSGESDQIYKGEIKKETVAGGVEPGPKPQEVQSPKMTDERIKELVRALENRHRKETTPYHEVLRDYGKIIDQLTFELQDIFNKRRHTQWEAGYKSGKKVHIGRAIQEEVSGASPFETGAFMRREQPQEVDYAIELLVDLSGSMDEANKIQEAYKATVVLAEVLNTIGVQFAITGFNAGLHEYKSYDSELSDQLRESFEDMLQEVQSDDAAYNDDGWALTSVHDRILAREERQKIVFVISDGQPAESYEHEGYDLAEVVKAITDGQKVKLIGLGLGRGTNHVSRYYPNSVANIAVHDLAKVLAQKVREAIENT
jgi:hypothetical protein